VDPVKINRDSVISETICIKRLCLIYFDSGL
jgi:hypothetical protein